MPRILCGAPSWLYARPVRRVGELAQDPEGDLRKTTRGDGALGGDPALGGPVGSCYLVELLSQRGVQGYQCCRPPFDFGRDSMTKTMLVISIVALTACCPDAPKDTYTLYYRNEFAGRIHIATFNSPVAYALNRQRCVEAAPLFLATLLPGAAPGSYWCELGTAR